MTVPMKRAKPIEMQAAETGEHLLRRRAQRLAAVEEQADSADHSAYLVFRVGPELYAVELSLLYSIHRSEGLAAVPCTPPYVAGILNVRGEVVVVLSAAALLGGHDLSRSASAQVLLVEHPRARLGLLVDEVVGVRQLELGALDGHLSSQDFIRGVADGRVGVLDLNHLFAVERIEVFEESSA